MSFILINSLVVEPGERATAQKTFGLDDPVFRDHFPGNPIVPGTLLTECMAQTAGWAIRSGMDDDSFAMLAMVERAKFRKPVRPGETLTSRAEVRSRQGGTVRVRTTLEVAGKRAAEATLILDVRPFPHAGGSSVKEYQHWRQRTLAALTGRSAGKGGEP